MKIGKRRIKINKIIPRKFTEVSKIIKIKLKLKKKKTIKGKNKIKIISTRDEESDIMI